MATTRPAAKGKKTKASGSAAAKKTAAPKKVAALKKAAISKTGAIARKATPGRKTAETGATVARDPLRSAAGSSGRKAKREPKHFAPPATLSEITKSLGVTDAEIARVRRILLKYGYIKEQKL